MPPRTYKKHPKKQEDSSSEEIFVVTPRPRTSKPTTIKVGGEKKEESSKERKKSASKKESGTNFVAKVTKKYVSSSDSETEQASSYPKKRAPVSKTLKKPTSTKKVISEDKESDIETPAVTPGRKAISIKKKPILSTKIASSESSSEEAVVKRASAKKNAPDTNKSISAKKMGSKTEKEGGKVTRLPESIINYILGFLGGASQLAYLGLSKKMGELANQMSINLSALRISPTDLSSIKKQYPGLKIVGLELDIEEEKELLQVKQYLVNLKELDLNCAKGTSLSDLIFLEACPELKKLTIKGSMLTIKGISLARRLEEINLNINTSGGQLRFDLSVLAALEWLKVLQIQKQNTHINSGDLFIAGTSNLTQLRKASFHAVTLEDDLLCKGCSNLTKLRLTVGEKNFSFLAPELPLRSLHINSDIRVRRTLNLSLLSKYKGLISFKLGGQTAVSIRGISFLKECPHLEKVIINPETPIKLDEDPDLLSNCPRLRILSLLRCAGPVPDLSNCSKLKQIKIEGVNNQLYMLGQGASMELTSLPTGNSLLELSLFSVRIDSIIVEKISTASNLLRLELDSCAIEADQLTQLSKLIQLEELKLGSGTEAKLDFPEVFKALKSLRKVVLATFPKADFSAFSESDSLTELELSSKRISTLSGLSGAPLLKALQVSSPSLLNCGELSFCSKLEKLTLHAPLLRELIFTRELSQLKELVLIRSSISLIDGLSYCQNLEKLSLIELEVANLDFLGSLGKLVRLQLETKKLAKLEIKKLLPNLEEIECINIRNNSVTVSSPESPSDRDILEIGGFEHCPKLKSLTLTGTLILNVDTLENCTQLEKVDLSNNTSLKSIKGLAECRKIKHLNLKNCNKIRDLSSLSGLTQLSNLTLSRRIANKNPIASILPHLGEKEVTLV